MTFYAGWCACGGPVTNMDDYAHHAITCRPDTRPQCPVHGTACDCVYANRRIIRPHPPYKIPETVR